ncbi:MAG: YHS domain-containing protein [Candidatus Tectimicrobiota bacterium]
MAQDPVCGAAVDEASAPASTEYKGETFYFCSQACLQAFKEDAEPFLDESPKVSPH